MTVKRSPIPALTVASWLTTVTWLFAALLLFAVAGCSSDDSPTGTGGGGTTTNSGVFLDSAVEGMAFASGSKNGMTDAQGTFTHDPGMAVEFKVGDIVIGSAMPAPVMTPVQLVAGAVDETNPTVTNIARFLQTIDDDANTFNGIKITDAIRTAAAGKSIDFAQDITAFENDTNAQSVVSDLTTASTVGQRGLISAAAAQTHLAETLAVASFAGTYNGTYVQEDFGDGSAPGRQNLLPACTITVNADGTLRASFSGLPGSINSTVSSDGSVDITQEGVPWFAFGTIGQNGVMSGMWYGVNEGEHGSFSASR